jgi:site-specific DNA-methyltransferase (adenine-specific)
MPDPRQELPAMSESSWPSAGAQLQLAPPPPSDRIVVSDAFELLGTLPDESVDLVITDPPYESLQLHRSHGTTTRLTTNWFTTVPDARLPELLASVHRVLRRDSHFYLFCDEVTADVIKQQQGIGAARLPNGSRRCACGFVYWKEIVWGKTTRDGTKIRSGTGYHYRAASERILFFEKGKRALADLGVPDVLLAPRSAVPGPAVKPNAVIRTLILQSSGPGDLVADPFCGTGVVGVEARAHDRRLLLGDIDLAYLDPQLADVAPSGSFWRAAPEVTPAEPPRLEELSGSVGEVRVAAEAAGWLEGNSATDELLDLLEVRPREREAAVRRYLRAPPTPGEPELLLAWRAWALSARRMA